MPAYQVTGNEYVSLPAIREDTGAVQGLTVLHMGAKGLLELCGGDAPLIAPVVRVAGQEAMLAKLRWRRENAWVPVAQGEAQGLTVTLTYLCPLGERAFFMRLEAKNRRDAPLEVWLGVRGQWTRTLHEVNGNHCAGRPPHAGGQRLEQRLCDAGGGGPAAMCLCAHRGSGGKMDVGRYGL